MIIHKIEDSFNPTEDEKCAVAKKGMVSSAFPEATMAGVEMLENGGNAVDAACATAFALGVCEPQSSGIGGQSMAILHINGKTLAIDGSTRAPSLAHLDRFKKGERTTGYKATTVPSTVAVLGHLNFRYGRLPWSEILQPAIRIARDGYRITELQSKQQENKIDQFLKIPSKSGARYFLKGISKQYNPGDLFIQSDLGDLLEYLAVNGAKFFYEGRVAQQIEEDMRANDGLLRAEDLALIPWPIERKPLKRRYRDVSISTIPPPAAGRTLLLVLMMLNNLPPRFLKSTEFETSHFLAETFRKAFRQRTQRPFDPNYYPQNSNKTMLSRDFARKLSMSIRDIIDPELPFLDPPDVEEEGETTHLSAMDNDGNAVGITQSIELVYGSKAAAEGLGFLYNNYMLAFDVNDASHPYYLRPNAIPWTSVAPAIVFHKNKPWIVVGSPGSERIYSTVSQFLVHMVDGHHSMGDAMIKPRLHCSVGGIVSLEADRFDDGIIDYLQNMGYKIDKREDYSFFLGAIHAVMRCQSMEGFQGVAEIRRDGIAAGVS
ncbi:gamma-glutamyltransferase family protein [Candidatus Latescibacterota bacterium]